MRTLRLEKIPPKYEKKRHRNVDDDEDSDEDQIEKYFAEDDSTRLFA